MMPSLTSTLTRGAPLLVALLGCGAPPFKPPVFCDSCPLPPTSPPVAQWVNPVAGGQINKFTILSAAATDDRQVTGVEFYRASGFADNSDWIKLHPGVIAAPPYTLDLSRYQDRLPTDDTYVYLHVVAHDIEGNADSAAVLVYFIKLSP